VEGKDAMTIKRSQAALYGPMLTSEQQYRKDVRFLQIAEEVQQISKEEQQQIVERARKGDTQAQEAIILSLVPKCESLSRHYCRTYEWASARIEYLDLVQVGNLAILQALPRALASDDPYPYLYKVARYEISRYCMRYASLITTPQPHPFVNQGKPLPHVMMESLNKPYDEENEERTWEACLAEKAPVEETERDYQPLYEAVEKLSPRVRETIKRHYGLGREPEPLQVISQSFAQSDTKRACSARGYERRGLQKLRQRLEAVYLTGGAAPLLCCSICGNQFEPVRSDQRYCSGVCKRVAYRQRKQELQAV
jgi:RNA polymerase sigma factor (sigma-70 family)